MRLFAHLNLRPQICTVSVSFEELVSAFQHLSHPFQDVGVVDDLVLDQFLGHRKQNLESNGKDILMQ